MAEWKTGLPKDLEERTTTAKKEWRKGLPPASAPQTIPQRNWGQQVGSFIQGVGDVTQAGVYGLSQGLTAGGGDELEALLRTGLSGAPVGENLANVQAARDQAYQKNPAAFIGSEVLGGLGGGGAIASNALTIPRVGQFAARNPVTATIAGGTAEGALGGALTADEGNRLEGAKRGAVAGSVLSGAGQALKTADDFFRPGVPKIWDRVKSGATLPEGDTRSLAELDPNARYVAAGAARRTGEGFQAAEEAGKNMVSAANAEIDNVFASSMRRPDGSDVMQSRARRIDDYKLQRDEAYADTYAERAAPDEFSQYLDTKFAEESIADAKYVLDTERLDYDLSDPVTLDYIQRAMRDRADDMKGNLKRVANTQRSEFITALDRKFPSFNEARSKDKLIKEMDEAYQEGVKAANPGATGIDDLVKDMNAEQLESLKAGFVDGSKFKTTRINRDKPSSFSFMDNANYQDKAMTIMGPEADSLMNAVDRAKNAAVTKNMISGGSATMMNQESSQALDRNVQLSLKGAVDKLTRTSDAATTELTRRLTAPHGAGQDAFMRTMGEDRNTEILKMIAGTSLMGGIMGGLSTR